MTDTNNPTLEFTDMSLDLVKKTIKPFENNNGKVRRKLHLPYES
jgi:hypothetical protein